MTKWRVEFGLPVEGKYAEIQAFIVDAESRVTAVKKALDQIPESGMYALEMIGAIQWSAINVRSMT